MSNIHILKTTGLAIRMPSAYFSDIVFDIDGFVHGFVYEKGKIKKRYRYYNGSFFTWVKYNHSSIPSGYYEEEKALSYLSYKSTTYRQPPSNIPSPTQMRKEFKFDEQQAGRDFAPSLDDIVAVKSIASSKHDFIYEENRAVFKIINKPNTEELKRVYKRTNGRIDFPTIPTSNNGFVSYELDLSDNFLAYISIDPISRMRRQMGYFYHKNLADRVNNWIGLSSTEKDEFDRITTLIVLRIRMIEKDIFSKLLTPSKWTDIEEVALGLKTETQAELSLLHKILMEIRRSWCLYYHPNSSNPLINTYTPVLPELPEIEVYHNYYTALVNLYNNFYRNLLKFKNTDSDDEMIRFLVSCLPGTLLGLIPKEMRVEMLVEYAKGNVFEDKERLLLKIISSFTQQEATYLLTELNNRKIPGEESYTLYETLYRKINDEKLGFGKDNRKALMLKLFYLWFSSDFNPTFASNNYTEPTKTDLIIEEYSTETVVLHYNHSKSFGFYFDNMDFSFSSNKILIEERKVEVTEIPPNFGNDYQTIRVRKYTETIGLFNYFQAISLNNYKENDVAIQIPFVISPEDDNISSALLPLFYLKYMDDVGESEDLWTGVGLLFDVALTFTGIGNLSKLRYLRFLGKFGKVIKGTSTPTETIFIVKNVWSATQGVAAAVEISGSLASIMLDYSTNNCSDFKTVVNNTITDGNENGTIPENLPGYDENSDENKEYKRCKLWDQIFFWMQIGSLGLDLLATKMIKKKSKELLDLGVPSVWATGNYTQIKDFVEAVGGNNTIQNYLKFLDSIPTESKTAITDKLSGFGDEIKLSFFNDFSQETQNANFWRIMANNNAQTIDNWKSFKDLNIPDFDNIIILGNNSLCAEHIDFYTNPNLASQLNKFDTDLRIKFLESSHASLTPKPGAGYIYAWRRMQQLDGLSDFSNPTILRQFDDIADETAEAVIYEMKQSKRGKDVRKLIKEDPTDIKNIMEPALTKPHEIYASKDLVSPRWTAWRKTIFFKHITRIGKNFENHVSKQFAKRDSNEYKALKEFLEASPINKNLDGYDLVTGVQLNIPGTGNYFVADQVFIKYGFADGDKIIEDIIVIESKLTLNTTTSIRQQQAITAAYQTGFSGFGLRSKHLLNTNTELGTVTTFDVTRNNFKFNGTPTILKAHDGTSPNKIDGFKQLTNQDNL